MSYQKQAWRDYDDTKTELQNLQNGAVVTPERMNHIETGIANSADKEEVTAQLAQTEASKVDKAGSGQVTYANLAQDAREQITGGNTAVVGVNAVIEENIANRAVTMNKLDFPSVHSVSISWGKYNVIINDTTKTVTFGVGSTFNVRLSDNTVVQSTLIPGGTSFTFDGAQSLVMNIDSRVVSLVDSTAITNRHVVLLVHHATIGFYEGYLYDNYKPKTNEFGLLYSSDAVPDFDFDNMELVLKRPRLIYENEFIVISDEEVRVSLDTGSQYVYGVVVLNLNTLEFSVEVMETFSGGTFNREDTLLIASYNKTNQFVYMAGAYTINGEMPNYGGEKSSIPHPQTNDFYLSGDFSTLYKSEQVIDMSTTLDGYSADEMYADYDNLMTAYPDFVEKNLLGYGSDQNGVEDDTLPIYEYVIKPYAHESMDEPPVILIQSGTHGNEKGVVYSTFEFFRQMFEGDKLESLQSNVIFKVIPIMNPGGFTDNTRNNRNGVNLNRNYDYMWSSANDEDKGSAPNSELETQISVDWIAANSNALAYIDYHNSIGRTPGYLMSDDDNIKKMYSSLGKRLATFWRKAYYNDTNEGYAQIIDSWSYGMSYQYVEHRTDIPHAFTIECGTSFTNVDHYVPEALQRGVDLLANMLNSTIDMQMKLIQ